MDFNIDNWLKVAIDRLQENFPKRLLFIGLQGSYNRGEATDTSDIDLVVILDVLDFEDLKIYRSIINNMPDKDKACGFISGRAELQKWSKTDMFQFYYDTKPLFGNLKDIIQPPTIDEVRQAVKIGAENLYHAAVHSFVHSNNYVQDLQSLYKMTFFVLQAKYFTETKSYISTKKQLFEKLEGADSEILNNCINKKEIESLSMAEIEDLYYKLIQWSSNVLLAKKTQ